MEREDARANGISEKRVHQREAYVRVIEEIIGPKTEVAAINFDMCLKVRGTLAKLPTNRTKIFGSLPLDEAIKHAEVEGLHPAPDLAPACSQPREIPREIQGLALPESTG